MSSQFINSKNLVEGSLLYSLLSTHSLSEIGTGLQTNQIAASTVLN